MKTVILAAGFGSRLWPLSTSDKPKQFQPLIHGQSLVAYTYQTMAHVIPNDSLYVLTLEGLEHFVLEQIPGISADYILSVPARRNTLPHTLWALNILADEPVLFRSVDHFLPDPTAFVASLKSCIERYEAGASDFTLLCTENSPYSANDGYALLSEPSNISQFIEKPIPAEYSALQAKGKLLRSPFIYIATNKSAAQILGGLDYDWARLGIQLLGSDADNKKQLFLDMPVMDISTSVFQESQNLKADVIDYEFVDVGTYSALYALNEKDAAGNVLIGDIITGTDCFDNFIVNQTSNPVVVQGISSSIVILTNQGNLVSSFSTVDAVGEIYKQNIHARK